MKEAKAYHNRMKEFMAGEDAALLLREGWKWADWTTALAFELDLGGNNLLVLSSIYDGVNRDTPSGTSEFDFSRVYVTRFAYAPATGDMKYLGDVVMDVSLAEAIAAAKGEK